MRCFIKGIQSVKWRNPQRSAKVLTLSAILSHTRSLRVLFIGSLLALSSKMFSNDEKAPCFLAALWRCFGITLLIF